MRRSTAYRTILGATVALSLFVIVAWCAGGIIRVRNAASRMTQSGMFCQLGVAMHSYHESKGSFPGANAPYTDDKGQSSQYPVSWRVLILPYIEEDKLFKRYRFDEPWDGPNNIELLKLMPRSYRHPKAEAEVYAAGLTHYRVFASRPDAKPSALFTDGLPGPKITEIPDGRSNTILIVEAEEAVPWTMPEILLYDRNQPLPKLGGMFKGQFQAALADGSVRSFPNPMAEDRLRAWITKDGGEKIEPD